MQGTRTYELAEFGQRFFAFVIDAIIISVVGGIFGLEVELAGGSLISLLFGAAYQWYFLTQQNGQTPGKMLLNIRVIKKDGSPIEAGDALVRFVGYLINSPIFLLGWLWSLWDPNSQGWHDKLASTYVIKTNSEEKVKNDRITI
jgi:uncharacterized RDD family membrane protein YckC